MRHVGRVWIETEGESAATAGELEIDPDSIRLLVAGALVGEWPPAEVRIFEADHGFRIAAGDETVRFVPDDLPAFLDATAPVRFRSRMKQQEPGSAPFPQTPPPPPLAQAQPPAPLSQPRPAGSQLIVVAKNPGVAAVMSFLWPGLGQIYNGEFGKGALFMLAQVINAILSLVVIGFFTGFAVWVWAIVDAYKGAETHNRLYSVAG